MILHLGVDIGGTKIETIVLDAAGTERFRAREPTPHGSYDESLELLVRTIRDAEHAAGARCSIGIGIPGLLSRIDGRLRNAYATPFNGQPLRADLEARLSRRVRIANDANCFALSEALDGAARNATVVFGAILGTGVGGGIAVNGTIVEGANAMAGEWGRNPLPGQMASDALPVCKCGRRGCIEAFLSGHGLAHDHAAVTGEQLSPEAIVSRAAAGDARCEATLSRYESRLAVALAGVVNLLDPEVIVLGGGLSGMSRLYESIPRLMGPQVYLEPRATRILPPVHGDASGVRGAAWIGRA